MKSQDLRDKLMNWRAELPALVRRYDARPMRERAMILAAVMGIAFMLMDQLWLDGAIRRYRAHQVDVSAWQGQRSKIESEVGALGQELRLLQQTKAQQVEQVRKRLTDAQAALRDGQEGVVSAQQMLPLLQQLMQRQGCDKSQASCGRLRVRSVKSLGRSEVSGGNTPVVAQAVQAASAAQAASGPALAAASATHVPSPGLWRHGIEITIEGSYGELAGYVQALEALPQRVLRGGMSFQVETYPKAALTLRLYTLSLDQSWLEI